MGKITSYTLVTETDAEDNVLIDGTDGTRRIKAKKLLDSVARSSNTLWTHRNIFGGKNLGTSVTAAQLAAIRDGSFTGMLTGDYWAINGVNWRIVDMDYWYNCGDTVFTSHHALIMPDSSLASAVMNSTATTEIGYVGSQLYTTTLPTVKATCEAAFPSAILTHRDFLVNAVTEGEVTAAGWMDSSVELPNEIMMYGSRVMSSNTEKANGIGFQTVNKTQLALFRLAPRYIILQSRAGSFWLRDTISATTCAISTFRGYAGTDLVTVEHAIRPVFPIG